MVKLTVDLIQGAGQYTNPVKDRELDLRGEGLGAFYGPNRKDRLKTFFFPNRYFSRLRLQNPNNWEPRRHIESIRCNRFYRQRGPKVGQFPVFIQD